MLFILSCRTSRGCKIRTRVCCAFALLIAIAAGARGAELPTPAPASLPRGDVGIAAKYPADQGIENDPAVIFHDDFETRELRQKWDNRYHPANMRLATEPENVNSGKRALEFVVPKQEAEVSNEVIKIFKQGYDTIFLRFYSKFEKGFDEIGSSHNGGYLAAIAPGVAYATPGVRADGHNKFMASFECWRDDDKTPSPGGLNVYCYHPAQRTEYGDHFFPSGTVLPFGAKPGDFGPKFVARPDITPKLGRWYLLRDDAKGEHRRPGGWPNRLLGQWEADCRLSQPEIPGHRQTEDQLRGPRSAHQEQHQAGKQEVVR